MHPFLPALALIFLLAADGTMAFLRFNASAAPAAGSLYAVVLVSLLIGAGLAFWLRRFGLLFPGWIAVLSLAWIAVLGLF